MNNENRMKLFFGFLAVLAVLLFLSYQQFQKTTIFPSVDAKLVAQNYFVGIDFSGLITKQLVKKGDTVNAGTEMFYLKSNSLLEKLQDGKLKKDDLFYPLNDNNEIVLKAPRKGYVKDVSYVFGSFVPGNEDIAELIDTDSFRAVSTFRLKEAEFGRLDSNNPVNIYLPDGTHQSSTIQNITILKSDPLRGTLDVEIESSFVIPSDKKKLIQDLPVNSTLTLTSHNPIAKLFGFSQTLGQLAIDGVGQIKASLNSTGNN